MSAPRTGKYGTAPLDNPDYRWVQMDPSLNRDRDFQWFIDIIAGTRIYGATNGTASDHIHMYFRDNTNSGLNLNPVTGEISKDGSVFGVLSQFVALAVLSAAAGAFSAGAAAEETAKGMFTPSGVTIPPGLVFPATA